MKNNRIVDLILGIAFFALGLMALNRPGTTLGFLVFFFGILAIVRGISTIFGFGSVNNKESKGFRIFIGILDVIIGTMFVTNIIRGALFLGILFSVWFMIESIGNLFLVARFSKTKGASKWLILLFDLISFVFAVMLLFNPLIATLALPKLVGFSAIAFGVVLVVHGMNFGHKQSE